MCSLSVPCSSIISSAYLSSITGANGRNSSRNLILEFTLSFISAFLGSARMLLLPKARGPNSILPWYQPTTFPSYNSSVTSSHNSASLRCLYINLFCSIAATIRLSLYSGPMNEVSSILPFINNEQTNAAPIAHPESSGA